MLSPWQRRYLKIGLTAWLILVTAMCVAGPLWPIKPTPSMITFIFALFLYGVLGLLIKPPIEEDEDPS